MWIEHKKTMVNLENVMRIIHHEMQIEFLHTYATEYKDVTTRFNFKNKDECAEAMRDILAGIKAGEKIVWL